MIICGEALDLVLFVFGGAHSIISLMVFSMLLGLLFCLMRSFVKSCSESCELETQLPCRSVMLCVLELLPIMQRAELYNLDRKVTIPYGLQIQLCLL